MSANKKKVHFGFISQSVVENVQAMFLTLFIFLNICFNMFFIVLSLCECLNYFHFGKCWIIQILFKIYIYIYINLRWKKNRIVMKMFWSVPKKRTKWSGKSLKWYYEIFARNVSYSVFFIPVFVMSDAEVLWLPNRTYIVHVSMYLIFDICNELMCFKLLLHFLNVNSTEPSRYLFLNSREKEWARKKNTSKEVLFGRLKFHVWKWK